MTRRNTLTLIVILALFTFAICALILPMFAAVILGGIGNPYGAMVGGMIIGLSQELSMLILPSEYKMGVSLGIMILVLLFKPKGLFGGIKA